jgi:hypothetical protein
MHRPIIYSVGFQGSIGGLGAPVRLPALAYWPALVSVRCSIDSPPVPRRKIRREVHRTVPLCCHRMLWVCPAPLFQSDTSFFTSRLQRCYAAFFRSMYNPSGVIANNLFALMYRLIAAATNRLSTFLSFLASLSEISAAPRGLPPASSKHSRMSAGILPGLGPLSLRLRLRFLPPFESDSASRNFWRSSSNSRSRIVIASRITWARTSLIEVAYLLSRLKASVHCSRTLQHPTKTFCTMYVCSWSSDFDGKLASAQ